MRSAVANRFQHCALHFEALPVLVNASEDVIDGPVVFMGPAATAGLMKSSRKADSPKAVVLRDAATSRSRRFAYDQEFYNDTLVGILKR